MAIVTRRIRPLTVDGQRLWTIGVPVHWGFKGITHGAMANNLTPFVGDANTRCPEYKAFLVNIEAAPERDPRPERPNWTERLVGHG